MALNLIITNQTSSTMSYLGGAVTISSMGYYTATSQTIFPLSRDPQLLADSNHGNVFISDTINTYTTTSSPFTAVQYLNLIASALGSQVVGYVGSATPSFAIMVGCKDSNGNLQPGLVDSGGNLLINEAPNSYKNITGNTTVTVKSGAGRLQSIMINRNWTGGTIVVYDGVDANGVKIATIDVGTPSGGLLSSSGVPGPINMDSLNISFTVGLTVVTSGSTSNNITILYQ